MLEIGNSFWENIKESPVINYKNEFINLHSFQEKLLRLAVKWTEYFASDILIFFKYMDEYFLQENIVEIDFYFRQMGIEWVTKNSNNEVKMVERIPDKFRGVAKLIFKRNDKSMELYWKDGNC